MDIDLEVYSYDQLGDQGDQALLALLGEEDDTLDALTFGLEEGDEQAFGEPVGQSRFPSLSFRGRWRSNCCPSSRPPPPLVSLYEPRELEGLCHSVDELYEQRAV
jgi:hypothetical protein